MTLQELKKEPKKIWAIIHELLAARSTYMYAHTADIFVLTSTIEGHILDKVQEYEHKLL